jgi:hypothetical protein
VREIIDVQIPRPRRWDQLIQSNEFRVLTHRIFHLLGDGEKAAPNA